MNSKTADTRDTPPKTPWPFWLKGLVWIAGIFVFLLVSIMLYMASFQDIPPPDISDLQRSESEMKLEDYENGYHYLKLAHKEFEKISGTPTHEFIDNYSIGQTNLHLETNNFDLTLSECYAHEAGLRPLKDFFESHKNVCDLIDQALAQEKCLSPEFDFDTPLGELMSIKGIAQQVYLTRSRWHLEEGRPDQAINDGLTALKLGHALTRSHGPAVTYLVGIAIMGMSIDQIRHILKNSSLSNKKLVAFQNALIQISLSKKDFAGTMAAEFNGTESLLTDIKNKDVSLYDVIYGGPQTRWLTYCLDIDFMYMHNRSVESAADYFRKLIKAYDSPESTASSATYFVDIRLMALLKHGNVIGKIITGSYLPALDGVCEEAYKTQNNLNALQIQIAVKRFVQKHGGVPKKLSDLAPEFLDALPKDVFSGKGFVLLAKDNVFYSVGTDRIDSGGIDIKDLETDFSNRYSLSDIFYAFTLPFKKSP